MLSWEKTRFPARVVPGTTHLPAAGTGQLQPLAGAPCPFPQRASPIWPLASFTRSEEEGNYGQVATDILHNTVTSSHKITCIPCLRVSLEAQHRSCLRAQGVGSHKEVSPRTGTHRRHLRTLSTKMCHFSESLRTEFIHLSRLTLLCLAFY